MLKQIRAWMKTQWTLGSLTNATPSYGKGWAYQICICSTTATTTAATTPAVAAPQPRPPRPPRQHLQHSGLGHHGLHASNSGKAATAAKATTASTPAFAARRPRPPRPPPYGDCRETHIFDLSRSQRATCISSWNRVRCLQFSIRLGSLLG